ncbi:hypothetical protein DSO57_1003564 [Entomophthora muscae]|uniref:Uncharacterized protein n=1 Tax=Entomophthora muscae TaxID=34485 RepID=A0ACC2RZM1_9FUNG|nr:hypothetical protein DSO57_1003564 [Entomophthora muscae]
MGVELGRLASLLYGSRFGSAVSVVGTFIGRVRGAPVTLLDPGSCLTGGDGYDLEEYLG